MNSPANFDALKEPRGFIRILQLFMTIFAFATTCGYSGGYDWTVDCKSAYKPAYRVDFYYPFSLSETASFHLPLCNGTKTETKNLFGGWSGAARFYVFVGVIALLYCLAALVLYIFFHSLYESDSRVPKIDFIVSGVFVLLWFIASVAWSDGVAKLKEYTEPLRVFQEVEECKQFTCNAPQGGATYGGLNVSLIFGYANVALWASGLWFLWKETPWFQSREEQNFGTTGAGGYGPDGSQM